MQEQLLNHIGRHALCKTTDKILLAVSGGMDSMVMFHLMRQAGYQLGVAHCNFQLRGQEALDDEAMVAETCRQYGVPLFVRRFDTSVHAASRQISIQMAARDLRYQWFGELLTSEGYDLLATAHHQSDVVESILLNLIRGTGIDGFRGIAVRKGKLIRPLLFATRRDILGYAQQENIAWHEDASNASDDYQRNFVRHQIIPRMEELNPSFESSFSGTQERILGAREMMGAFLSDFRKRAVEEHGGERRIRMDHLQEGPAPAVLLWELIKDAGFKYDQCRKIVGVEQPGKVFASATHRLVVDRSHYIIERRQDSDFVSTTIERGDDQAGYPPFALSLREVRAEDFTLIKDSTLAQLDADLLQFPLVWRKWLAGDYFAPLGMRQEKKLSDFLIDLKIPFNNKADITVIESGGQIVWVVGFRISDRFKVTSATRTVLVITPSHEGQ